MESPGRHQAASRMEYRWGCDLCSYEADGCSKCRASPFLSRPKARWDPAKGLYQDSIPAGPSFRPTAEEFKDPIGYLQSIAPQVAPYGIAHIIPPEGWHPPSTLLDPATGIPRGDLFIPVRRQPTHLLCRRFATSDGGPPSPGRATPTLNNGSSGSQQQQGNGSKPGLNSSSSPKKNIGRKRFEELPNNAGRMSMVKQPLPGMGMGGAARLEESFGFEDLQHPFTLQEFHIYNNWAMQQHFSGHEQAAAGGKEGSPAGSSAAADAAPAGTPAAASKAALRPALNQIEAEFWRIVEQGEDQVEALYGQDVDTSKYGSGFPARGWALKLAATAPSGTSSSAHVELGGPTDISKRRENWAEGPSSCCCSCHQVADSQLGKRTASGSMAAAGGGSSSKPGSTGTAAAGGTGGPAAGPCLQAVQSLPSSKVCWGCAVRGYCAHPWNINNIPTATDSVLRFVREGVNGAAINGIMVPWLYAGSCFSSFSWHIEDHGLYSINYNHIGAPKVWYGVPGYAAAAFDAAMQDALPHLFAADPNLLHRLTTMVSPQQLAARGIPVCRIVHHPGSFVVTFPDAYHSGFNAGFNIAEAVNFAMPDWLPCGTASVSKYKLQRRPTTFSYDAMLLNVVATSVGHTLQKQWQEEKQRQLAAKRQKRAAGAGGFPKQQQQLEAPGSCPPATPATSADGAAVTAAAATASAGGAHASSSQQPPSIPTASAGAAVVDTSATATSAVGPAQDAAPHPDGLLQYLLPPSGAALVAEALKAGRLAPPAPTGCSWWADWYSQPEWWRLLQLMDPVLQPLLEPQPLLVVLGAGAQQVMKTIKGHEKDPAARLVELARFVELASWQRALPAAEQRLLTQAPTGHLAAAAAKELLVRMVEESRALDAAVQGGQVGGIALMRGCDLSRCPQTGVHTSTKSCECRVCGCDLTLAGVVTPALPGVAVCAAHAGELPGEVSAKVLLLRHLPGSLQMLLQLIGEQVPEAKAALEQAKAQLCGSGRSCSPSGGQDQKQQLQKTPSTAAAAEAQQQQQQPQPGAAAGGPAALQQLDDSIQLLQQRLAGLQQQLAKFEMAKRQLEAEAAGNPAAEKQLQRAQEMEALLVQRLLQVEGLKADLVQKADLLRAQVAAAGAGASASGEQTAAGQAQQQPVAVVVKQEVAEQQPARSSSSGDSCRTSGAAPRSTALSAPPAACGVVLRRLGKLYEPQQLSAALFDDLEEQEDEEPAADAEAAAAGSKGAAATVKEEVHEWALKPEVKEDEFGFVRWEDAIEPPSDTSGDSELDGPGGMSDAGSKRRSKKRSRKAAPAAADGEEGQGGEFAPKGDAAELADTSDDEFHVGDNRVWPSQGRGRKRRATAAGAAAATAPAAGGGGSGSTSTGDHHTRRRGRPPGTGKHQRAAAAAAEVAAAAAAAQEAMAAALAAAQMHQADAPEEPATAAAAPDVPPAGGKPAAASVAAEVVVGKPAAAVPPAVAVAPAVAPVGAKSAASVAADVMAGKPPAATAAVAAAAVGAARAPTHPAWEQRLLEIEQAGAPTRPAWEQRLLEIEQAGIPAATPQQQQQQHRKRQKPVNPLEQPSKLSPRKQQQQQRPGQLGSQKLVLTSRGLVAADSPAAAAATAAATAAAAAVAVAGGVVFGRAAGGHQAAPAAAAALLPHHQQQQLLQSRPVMP